ncbi:Myosin-binding protein [Quillaja saponaria]|uniref:Myosin-binding protein n=1 Tax=Quillaja saponaria TaxID=32244 RepID=A0AAD7KUD3_QUISA|nr:Myosin-binding protein [Quillaja saponaria]
MATRSLPRYVELELGKLPHFFIYAILEWVLIVILFIYGFLAFVANEFAKFFELRTPCFLCTRIDHLLVHRNPDFYYNDSMCEAHHKAVSSLAYCHDHKKLSDIRKMCEGCLLSFATEKESDTDTYKSLVGILHKDLECFVEDDQQIQLSLHEGKKDDEFQVEKSSTNRCSCCGVPLKVKSSYSKGKNAAATFSLAPTPSPRAHPYVTLKNEESRGLELPHIRYTELKFMSDNDSEVPEDEDASYVNSHDTHFREEAKTAAVPLLTEAEELNDESHKTPSFIRGNRFFGIPLTDSASNTPRWASRIHRKSPLEKTESASDSTEGNLSHEGDGDSILHHLKRQVRLDRKSLMALYMELDEERSASAVAANNAMAMITRLQAEKAAVHMEALQYQRMMEEQAEYDQEALQATNDLLSKREEELKALEAELEVYREKYGCLTEFVNKGRKDDSDEEYQFKSQSQSSLSGGKSECVSPPFIINEGENHGENVHNDDQAVHSERENGGVGLNEPVKDFKGENTYLLGRLKKLERKAQMSENADHSLHSSPYSIDNIEDETGKGSEDTLIRELSILSERVKALEADSGFLEYAAKKLETHGEETTILTEISQNLQKLRHHLITSD